MHVGSEEIQSLVDVVLSVIGKADEVHDLEREGCLLVP